MVLHLPLRYLAAFSLLAGLGCAAAAAANSVTCNAIVTLSNAWVTTTDNATYSSVNINLVNTAKTLLTVPWTLTLKNPAYGNIHQVCKLLLGKHI